MATDNSNEPKPIEVERLTQTTDGKVYFPGPAIVSPQTAKVIQSINAEAKKADAENESDAEAGKPKKKTE